MGMYCLINGMKVLGTTISADFSDSNSGYKNLSYLGTTSCRTYDYENHKEKHTDIVNVWLGTHLLSLGWDNIIYYNGFIYRSSVDIDVIRNTIKLIKNKESLSKVDVDNLLVLIELRRKYKKMQKRRKF